MDVVGDTNATIRISESLLKRAKAKAADQGISVSKFVTEAIQEKLNLSDFENKPWMRVVGGLRHLKKETARINRIIEEEFGQIDPKGLE